MPTARDLPGLRLYLEPGGQNSQRGELYYGLVDGRDEHLIGVTGDATDGYQPHSARRVGSLLYRGKVDVGSGFTVRAGIMEMQGKFEQPEVGITGLSPQTYDDWDVSHRDLVVDKDLGDGQSLSVRAYRNAETSHNVTYTDTTYSTVNGEGLMDMAGLGQEVLYNFNAGDWNRIGIGYQRRDDVETGASVGDVRRELLTAAAS
jgi:hypothetical protein